MFSSKRQLELSKTKRLLTRSLSLRAERGEARDSNGQSSSGSSTRFPRHTPRSEVDANRLFDWLDLDAVPYESLEYVWRMYFGRKGSDRDFYHALQKRASELSVARQQALLDTFTPSLTASTAVMLYTYDSNEYVNNYLRKGDNKRFWSDRIPEGAEIPTNSSAQRVRQLTKILSESFPQNGDVMLYRGGHGGRGTSGKHFREGSIRPGDILVNLDFLSFTENPYTTASFCCSSNEATNRTSVVFEMSKHFSAKPIAPLSVWGHQFEDESLCPPMCFFKVVGIKTIKTYVDDTPFPLVIVSIEEIASPENPEPNRRTAGGRGPTRQKFFDFRTGEPFDFEEATRRLNAE